MTENSLEQRKAQYQDVVEALVKLMPEGSTERERDILWNAVFHTQRIVAQKLQISQQRVSEVVTKYNPVYKELQKLKKHWVMYCLESGITSGIENLMECLPNLTINAKRGKNNKTPVKDASLLASTVTQLSKLLKDLTESDQIPKNQDIKASNDRCIEAIKKLKEPDKPAEETE
jgi:hypothetical protein